MVSEPNCIYLLDLRSHRDAPFVIRCILPNRGSERE